MDVCILGLQNSGKTTLLRVLAGQEFTEDTIPTVGFSLQRVKQGSTELKCWDLGGQKRFQPMWERYARGVNAIMYVVDSADPDKFSAAKDALHALVSKPNLHDIPLLVLANKNDLSDAVDVDTMIEKMELRKIVHRELSCYSISAKESTNLEAVLSWLVSKSEKRP